MVRTFGALKEALGSISLGGMRGKVLAFGDRETKSKWGFRLGFLLYIFVDVAWWGLQHLEDFEFGERDTYTYQVSTLEVSFKKL